MKRRYTQEEVERRMIWNLYTNPDDLNIFVRKRGRRCAWTMNMGNKWAWVFIGAVLLIVLLINTALQYAA
ncbi:MAG: hypothetical protein IJB85_04005 [Clostridia bacterium]|nr:hypothetical protein [Clostridia bacterium]